jgi:predicted enzyme related to lactoylglutathione lyase
VGVELYFDDLPRAKAFYAEVLGLALAEEAPDHHARFQTGEAFLCLEKRGAEPYSSADKAVVFFEVDNLERVLAEVESRHLVQHEASAAPPWAVLHDPEGHNVLLLEAPAPSWGARGAGGVMRPTDLWVRVYGDAAVLTGVVTGAETSGPRSRITKTFVRQQGEWRLAALHSSGISER